MIYIKILKYFLIDTIESPEHGSVCIVGEIRTLFCLKTSARLGSYHFFVGIIRIKLKNISSASFGDWSNNPQPHFEKLAIERRKIITILFSFGSGQVAETCPNNFWMPLSVSFRVDAHVHLWTRTFIYGRGACSNTVPFRKFLDVWHQLNVESDFKHIYYMKFMNQRTEQECSSKLLFDHNMDFEKDPSVQLESSFGRQYRVERSYVLRFG